MNDYSEGFGKRLKKLRTDANSPMTQEKLAEKLGVSPQAVSRWENGATMPDLPMIPAMANIFGVTTDYLLGVNITGRDRYIKDIIDRAMKRALGGEPVSSAERDAALRRSIAVLREGLERYPGDFELTAELINALTEYGLMKKYRRDSTGREEFEEAIACADYIIEKCPDASTRCNATVSRIQLYGYIGGDSKIHEHIAELAPMYGCREALLVNALNDTLNVRKAASDCFNAMMNTAMDVISRLMILKDSHDNHVFTDSEQEKLLGKFIGMFNAVYGDDVGELQRYYLLPFTYLRLSDLRLESANTSGALEAITNAVDIITHPFEVPQDKGEDSLIRKRSEKNAGVKPAASMMAANLLNLLQMADRREAFTKNSALTTKYNKLIERLKAIPHIFGEDSNFAIYSMADDDEQNQ